MFLGARVTMGECKESHGKGVARASGRTSILLLLGAHPSQMIDGTKVSRQPLFWSLSSTPKGVKSCRLADLPVKSPASSSPARKNLYLTSTCGLQ